MLVEARDIVDGVRVLALNRPPANAISGDFLEALGEQCKAASEDDRVRAVIVTGNDRFFSGGLDLKEASSGASRVGNLAGTSNDGIFMLWTLPKPTVAMVNSHAIAGGVIIALACDFRITQSGNHRFGLNEVAIGMGFPRGAFEIARLALTNQQLRWTLLEAGLFDVNRAHELGIVDEIVEPGRLESRCIEVAKRLAANGRLAYAHTKRRIQAEAVVRALNQDQDEARELAHIGQSDESRALLAAQVKALTNR
ncbi:MAG TPA: enoyl-CoA hydratase/isomerase family protein [Candidatus Binataceae bacterium]|nr:enoyl-CoA hydratase/isomerase family protein [Candidatus Binataceae bacterium]